MFSGFANVWTPVATSRLLKHTPISIQVAGEKIALFRGADNAPAALMDRCLHRGVALSNGRVRSGCLECPFHGWQYRNDGQVAKVPWNPQAKVENLHAVAFPAVELAGIIWLYTACLKELAQLPEPPYLGLQLAPSWSGGAMVQEKVVATHWTRVMENALDFAHLPFVHRRTIGFAMQARAQQPIQLQTKWTPSEFGARVSAVAEGASGTSPMGRLDFYAPNIMRLHFSASDTPVTQFLAALPIDEGSTRVLMIGRASLAYVLLGLANQLVLAEDTRVIESSSPAEVPGVASEFSVESDRATLAFRKYYNSTLRNSGMRLGEQETD